MKVFSRDEWEAECGRVAPSRFPHLSLMEYGALHNEIADEWRRRFPGVDFSNRRYACHLEQALRQGENAPQEYIETIRPEDVQFDLFAMPHLRAALAASCN
jgi:hypothetical protein